PLGAGVAGVAAGSNTTCAVKTDGSLWCWGDNPHGELGNGTKAGSATPFHVAALPSVAWARAGADHVCAAATDGSLWCWGYGYPGDLGDGGFAQREAPVQVLAACP